MREIVKLSNGTEIYFSKGTFDHWGVFVKLQNGVTYMPKDKEYFLFFQNLSKKYNKNIVYEDFIDIYKKVTDNAEKKVLEIIKKKSEKYLTDSLDAELNFIVIYFAMISERNGAKKYLPLKERIKHLGFYQAVIEDISVDEAATFSVGKKAHELIKICENKGI